MSAQAKQMLGSLLVAALIVVVAILVVNAKFGTTSAADREARQDRQEQRIDAQEERREQQEEQREQP
jgi:hypothetical protein